MGTRFVCLYGEGKQFYMYALFELIDSALKAIYAVLTVFW